MLLSALVASGCDAMTAVEGAVKDQEGRTISGASIRLAPSGAARTAETTTAADGAFSASVIHGARAGDFALTTGAPGFKPVTVTVEAKQQNRCDVVLARDDAPAPSTATCARASH